LVAERDAATGLVRLVIAIDDAWLDARGELAPPFYTAVFDLGIDALKQVIGIDETYRERERRSTVALEAHVVLLAPVPAGSRVSVETRIVDCDAKRLHVAQEMRLDATTVALRESMTVSFDLDARRSCPFGAAVAARIDSLYQAQRVLPPYRGRADRLGLARPA